MKNVCYKLRDVPRMSTRSFATGTGEADNTEEFADEKWSIHVQHYVKIEAKIEYKGFSQHTLEYFNRNFGYIQIGSQGGIHFKVNIPKTLNVPSKIKWYWKIRNVGSAAIKHNNIRGQLVKGKTEQEESTSFAGPHYVEFYGIKNEIVLVFGKLEVPLKE